MDSAMSCGGIEALGEMEACCWFCFSFSCRRCSTRAAHCHRLPGAPGFWDGRFSVGDLADDCVAGQAEKQVLRVQLHGGELARRALRSV